MLAHLHAQPRFTHPSIHPPTHPLAHSLMPAGFANQPDLVHSIHSRLHCEHLPGQAQTHLVTLTEEVTVSAGGPTVYHHVGPAFAHGHRHWQGRECQGDPPSLHQPPPAPPQTNKLTWHSQFYANYLVALLIDILSKADLLHMFSYAITGSE